MLMGSCVQTRVPDVKRQTMMTQHFGQSLDQRQCVARCRSERRVVEDAPRGNATPSQVLQLVRERVEKVVFIGRVVNPRRAMESKIRKPAPSAWLAIAFGSWRIRGDACDFEFIQKAIGAAFKPARMPRFECDAAIESFSQHGEKRASDAERRTRGSAAAARAGNRGAAQRREVREERLEQPALSASR